MELLASSGFKKITRLPIAVAKMGIFLFGFHRTIKGASSKVQVFKQRPDEISHNFTVLSSDAISCLLVTDKPDNQSHLPEASQIPKGSIDMLLTFAACPLYRTDTTVGNGFNSLGLGSLGIRDSGSMLTWTCISHMGSQEKRKKIPFSFSSAGKDISLDTDQSALG